MIKHHTNAKILRHKAGLVGKTTNLDKILKDDPTADPLMGNYTLVKVDGIMTAFQGVNNQVSLVALSTSLINTQNGSEVEIQQEIEVSTGNPGTEKKVALCAADLDGDGKEEVAMVYTENDQQLFLTIANYTEEPGGAITASIPIPLGSCMNSNVWIGYTQPENIANLVVAWVNMDGNVQFWSSTFSADLNPISPVSYAGPKLAGNYIFDIATGVFTGTVNDEFAIFYEREMDAEGKNLSLDVYTFDNNQLALQSSASVGCINGEISCLNIAAGAFLSATIQDGIALAWNNGTNSTMLQTWQFQSSPAPILQQVWQSQQSSNFGFIRIAVGDLNNNGIEELVVGTVQNNESTKGYLVLQVFSFANTLEPTLVSTGYMYGDSSYSFISIDFKLKIAYLENSTGIGIVIAAIGTDYSLWTQQGYARTSIAVVQVDVDLNLPVVYHTTPTQIPGVFSQNLAYDSNKGFNMNMGLCLGDYSGKSIRVGPPKPSTLDQVNSIIAVVNVVPLLKDFEDAGSSVQTSFDKSQSNETSLALHTNRTYTTSDSLSANFGLDMLGSLNQSMTNTYGQDFGKSTEKLEDITTSINVLTQKDDIIILNVNVYNTWEYPVIDQTGKKGCLLVIFPQSTGDLKICQGLDLDSLYKPSHFLQDVLSYSALGPQDYNPSDGSFCNMLMEVAGLQVSVDANWTNETSSSVQTTYTQDLNIGTNQSLNITPDFLQGFSLGLDHNFDDDYSKSKTSTHDIEFTESTNINMTYMPADSIDLEKTYTVQPFVYWSKTGHYLKVDYAVTIPNSSLWYAKQFSNPDPCFYLPWGQTDSFKQFSRDIDFAANQLNASLTDVFVTVHNDTYAATKQLPVAIYNGNPAAGGVLIKQIQLNPIGPRSSAVGVFEAVSLPLTGSLTNYSIYAVIDPASNLPKTKGVAKIAFGCYPTNYISSSEI